MSRPRRATEAATSNHLARRVDHRQHAGQGSRRRRRLDAIATEFFSSRSVNTRNSNSAPHLSTSVYPTSSIYAELGIDQLPDGRQTERDIRLKSPDRAADHGRMDKIALPTLGVDFGRVIQGSDVPDCERRGHDRRNLRT